MTTDKAPARKPPSGVTIRISQTGEDIAARIDLGRRAHAESAFADLSLDKDRVRHDIERGLARPDTHCLLQAEFEGEIVGVLYGVVSKHFMSFGRVHRAHPEREMVRDGRCAARRSGHHPRMSRKRARKHEDRRSLAGDVGLGGCGGSN